MIFWCMVLTNYTPKSVPEQKREEGCVCMYFKLDNFEGQRKFTKHRSATPMWEFPISQESFVVRMQWEASFMQQLKCLLESWGTRHVEPAPGPRFRDAVLSNRVSPERRHCKALPAHESERSEFSLTYRNLKLEIFIVISTRQSPLRVYPTVYPKDGPGLEREEGVYCVSQKTTFYVGMGVGHGSLRRSPIPASHQ